MKKWLISIQKLMNNVLKKNIKWRSHKQNWSNVLNHYLNKLRKSYSNDLLTLTIVLFYQIQVKLNCLIALSMFLWFSQLFFNFRIWTRQHKFGIWVMAVIQVLTINFFLFLNHVSTDTLIFNPLNAMCVYNLIYKLRNK